ncbi:MAG: hypothetical protein L3K03_00020 [Thermoplasmata archaeon]|nr:hypothetical protein [Thermoplasmata archaeon]
MSFRNPNGQVEHSIHLPADQNFLAFGPTVARHPSVRWEIQGIAPASDGTAVYDIVAYGASAGELLGDLREELGRAHRLASYQPVFESRDQAEALFQTRSLLPPETVTILQRLVVLPIRILGGVMEIAFWSRQEEVTAVQRSLEHAGWGGTFELRASESAWVDHGPIFPPEDLALLGVVAAMGYYRDPMVHPLSGIAFELGIDPAQFVERIRSIEQNVLQCSEAVFDPHPPSSTRASLELASSSAGG